MPKLKSRLRSGGRQARRAMLVAAAASIAAASFVAVSSARADTTDILLEQLRAKGILSPHEFHKLKLRHEHEKAAMYRRAGPPGGVIVKGPAPEYVTVCPKHICMRVGQVDVSLSGDLVFGGVETFGAHGTNNTILGGLAGAGANGSNQSYNSIQAGLLPSAIVLSLSTHQMGYDLGFTIGAYTGGSNIAPNGANANGGGSPIALGTPGIDLRQIFGTVGTPTFGTVKIGRDLGLFGSDAILNDATLLGMGSPLTTGTPGNTTLGRIGVGYVYADWIPQVTYTTPDMNGFTASIGAFTPLHAAAFGAGALDGVYTGQDVPMVQGQLKWKGAVGPGAKLTLSADGVWQHHAFDLATGSAGAIGGANDVDSWGIDGFGKVDIAGFSLVGYGYYGKGLGTTGLFYDSFDTFGNARQSYGGYVQGSYTFNKFTLGASWGVSGLKATSGDYALSPVLASELVKWNESVVGFARYQLTTWMALQGEYVHTWSTNQMGQVTYNDALWLGTAWFF